MADGDGLDPTLTGFGESQVMGHIRPPFEKGGDRVFKINRRSGYYQKADECQHRVYVLDEDWSTVTCDACGEKLDPFAVLMHHAVWEERMDGRRHEIERAEEWMLKESLRRLRRLVDTTDEERAEVIALLDDWRTKAEDMREPANRIEAAVRARKNAKAAARMEKKIALRRKKP